MKRKGFIAGILVLSMLLMGTGYAYWTDKLTVVTTADTGELKVKFLDLALYGQYTGGDKEEGWSIIDGTGSEAETKDYYFKREACDGVNNIGSTKKIADYTTFIKKYTQTTFAASLTGTEQLGKNPYNYPEKSIISDQINIKLTDMYPGYAQAFQADIANLGTLTAKLSAVTGTVTGVGDKENKMLGIAMQVLREYAGPTGNSEGHVNVFDTLAEAAGIKTDDNNYFFSLGGVRFLRLSALPYVGKYFEKNSLFVQPDDNRMDLYFAIAMDPDATGVYTTGKVNAANGTVLNSANVDADTQQKDATVTIDFLWDQFNVDDTVASADTNYHLED